jgi:hypothetical protein
VHPQAAVREGDETVRSGKAKRFRGSLRFDASQCSAACVGVLCLILLASCRLPLASEAARVYLLEAPDGAGERSCAWFGDVRGPVLYFGVSAFWSALRGSGGDPMADLATPGPRWIGRFDLARERFLAPLVLEPAGAASGVWDVLAHPNGRVYFTTYFDLAGSVDPASGEVERFAAAGLGLNELALGENGEILVTRYGLGEDATGALVVLSERGEVLAEHTLASAPGRRALAKSVALDPKRREVWLNTDLLPRSDGGQIGHDTRVLAVDGRELRTITRPEIQLFAFEPDGTGLFAEAAQGRLWLRRRSPAGLDRFVLLDGAFDAAHDFAQDLRVEADGSSVITRWSGHVHVVEQSGRSRNLVLPRSAAGELYYTATRRGSRICATRCGRIEVVCDDLPPSSG